jgi:cell division protein FtsZ
VVATGIDGTGEVAMNQPRSFALGGSRAPKSPVLEMPGEDEEFELSTEAEADAEPEEASTYGAAAEREPLDLGAMPADFGDDESETSEEYDDDVDGIVDPLAGLRNDSEADDDDGEHGGAAAAHESEEDDGALWDDDGARDTAGAGPDASPTQDELLLDADRLAAADEPVRPMLGGGRRRGLVSGDGDTAGSGGGGRGGSGSGGSSGGAGSTLFERMANLSRGGSRPADEEDEEGEDDSGSASLSIPRFLGRQNNQ